VEISFGSQGLFDERPPAYMPEWAVLAYDLQAHAELISRNHLAPKFTTIDTREQRCLTHGHCI
jgi:hypothetical protein